MTNSFLYLLNLCTGPNPLGCGIRWRRAILLLTTGLLAASKTGRAASRLFITSCLWNIDFVASGLLTCVWEIFISYRTVVGGILWACFIFQAVIFQCKFLNYWERLIYCVSDIVVHMPFNSNNLLCACVNSSLIKCWHYILYNQLICPY